MPGMVSPMSLALGVIALLPWILVLIFLFQTTRIVGEIRDELREMRAEARRQRAEG